MQYILIALKFLPLLISLAEKLLGDGTGPQKKDFVLEALPSIAQGIEDVSTGGQKETWKAINDNKETFGKAIDAAVSIMYPKFTDVGDR